MELSLYIHIPFCVSKCDYCDFFSEEFNHLPDYLQVVRRGHGDFFDVFLDDVIKDIYEQVDFFNVDSFPTVYIGGGTPSVLGKDIKILFNALKSLPAFAPIEFTVEANPESLTEEFLVCCKEGGVTRLSLGVQTFYEPSRSSVNRKGDSAMLEKALSLANKYFPGNLSADLITGFPFHTKEIVKEDIKRLLEHNPAHVSVYSLTVEKETPLYKKLKTGALSLPDKDTSDELWLTARDILVNSGFQHYEVSNFAKEGKQCLHNIRYWRMQGWLGAGPSASGTIVDFDNGTALRTILACTAIAHKEQIAITKEQLLKEVILMGYRYCEGPDPKWGVEKLIPKTLEKWKGKDIMLFLNSFLIDAFGELDGQAGLPFSASSSA